MTSVWQIREGRDEERNDWFDIISDCIGIRSNHKL